MQRYTRVEVTPTTTLNDTALCRAAHDLGLVAVTAIYPARLFFLAHPDLTDGDVEKLCATLLADPVTEQYQWQWLGGSSATPCPVGEGPGVRDVIEVEWHPGVTDRVAVELQGAAHRLGLPPLKVATGSRYRLEGALAEADLHRLARQVLCNEVVQRYQIGPITPAFVEDLPGDGLIESFDLAVLDDEQLVALSRERRLALNLAEMAVLREFCREAGRPLTDAELEMAAQTWSEHCFHKTFKATIEYRELGIDSTTGQPTLTETIDGLLNQTIRAATEACHKAWVLSAFVDNAGIIDFDGEYVLSFKVETHNHPSALEPFGGANTGVGGVIRDIVGVSARPIAVTDVLCFGPQDLPHADLPAGVLHPRRVKAGVVAGVGDYGNKMGVPTVNGAILYAPGYTANPLVYCGCVGLAPAGSHVTAPQPGDRLIVLGGQTGRDGLRGATFSSLDLDDETGQIASTAVQIGDPIIEKDVTEVILAARDARLYHAITDCGAGGLSSAIGEMAETLGAAVELSRVSLKYRGLRPWEIWLSEAQERMVLAVPPEHLDALAGLCRRFGVNFDDVGQITGDGQMLVTHNERMAVNLPMALLHEKHPRLSLTATWTPPQIPAGGLDLRGIDPNEALLALLAAPNVASKEAVIRTYDHEVQGGTVIKPLTGWDNHGPSDAAVLKPLGTKTARGVAISNGINPAYGRLDPYAMAVSAVDEAVRNAVAVGADPDRLALLDNFCWGNPNLPDRLGGLVRAAKGCYDAARAFDAPFISGKDSLNNEYVDASGQRTPIPGTLLVSAIAIVPEIQRVVTMDAKYAGSLLYLVGETGDELGGSLLAVHYDLPDCSPPPALPRQPLTTARALHQAIRRGLVQACHDLSEGGLAVAAAEMALAGGLGMILDLERVPLRPGLKSPHPALLLFSESNGRWLVEVLAKDATSFEEVMADCPAARCGVVTQEAVLRAGPLEVEVERLDRAWRG
jgi:phosphoribosylformylglycinamidine synthase